MALIAPMSVPLLAPIDPNPAPAVMYGLFEPLEEKFYW